jgi:hypothetical protein
MKRVFVMVLHGADGAQFCLKLVRTKDLGHGPTSSLGFLCWRFLMPPKDGFLLVDGNNPEKIYASFMNTGLNPH